MGGVRGHEADPEEDRARRRVHRSRQVDLHHLRRAGDQELVGGEDLDAVGREGRRAGDRRDGRRGRGEVGLEHRPRRVGLREEDHALAGVRPGEMAGPVQAAGNHVVRVRHEVEAGDRARVGAHVEEAAVAGDEHAAWIGDRRGDHLVAGAQVDPLDVAARELRHVREAVRLVQGDLVDAVQSGGHHGRGGPVHVRQAEPEQRAGRLGDVGMEAVGAQGHVGRAAVAGAEHRLDVRVAGDGADGARAGVGDVELVGTEAVRRPDCVCKAGGDGYRNGWRHLGLLCSRGRSRAAVPRTSPALPPKAVASSSSGRGNSMPSPCGRLASVRFRRPD